MEQKIEIAFYPPVLDHLDQLSYSLYKNDYFGFIDSAIDYIDRMVDYIVNNIHHSPHKKAPHYFNKFGNELFYITYQSSKQTSWYILFNKNENRYLIKHITNNHISGHLFNI
jgi:hypothetical protein